MLVLLAKHLKWNRLRVGDTPIHDTMATLGQHSNIAPFWFNPLMGS